MLFKIDIRQPEEEMVANSTVYSSSNHTKTLIAFFLLFGFLSFTFGAIFSPITYAYTANRYETTDTSFVPGAVMALTGDGRLELASTQSTTAKYLGVVVRQADGAVYIADQGIVSVLVTDTQGSLNEGTQIAESNIAGVAAATQPGYNL